MSAPLVVGARVVTPFGRGRVVRVERERTFEFARPQVLVWVWVRLDGGELRGVLAQDVCAA